MEHSDFSIGTVFYTGSGTWRCTDVGTRTIVAIKISGVDPKNLAGPPYSVAEDVFDEYDIEGCSLDPKEFADDSDE